MTILHAGGKFGGDGYKVSGGLHGVGVSVVNALSSTLEVWVRKAGQLYYQCYHQGLPVEAVKNIGVTEGSGTTVRFTADPEIFETIEFNYEYLTHRLRELAFLNRGVKIILQDERPPGRLFTSITGVLLHLSSMSIKRRIQFTKRSFISLKKLKIPKLKWQFNITIVLSKAFILLPIISIPPKGGPI